jgi:hypothetical protein
VDVIGDWGIIEADFLREYRIDLSADIHSMTWRRFSVLLNHLSVDSLLRNIIEQRKKGEVPIEVDVIKSNKIINNW